MQIVSCLIEKKVQFIYLTSDGIFL